METYVFANQKGGVGKTTVTLGIAAELAGRGARVLLIDLDAQASATKVLGIDVDGRCSVADAMLEPERFRLCDAIVGTDWGFDLAPAETALASRESRRSTADEFVLRRQLGSCGGYDLALVDCPPSLGVLTLNALAAASHLVVVTEPSFLALQGIEELLETRELVRAHYNSDLALAGVVVNRVERTVEHRAALAEIRGFFGPDLVWTPALPKRTVSRMRRGAAARSRTSTAGPLANSRLSFERSPTGSKWPVSSREPRVALGNRKPVRPHPAAPPTPAGERIAAGGGARDEGGLVMFCVRVTPFLRRRVKLAAVGSGRTIQELATEALEEACARVEG